SRTDRRAGRATSRACDLSLPLFHRGRRADLLRPRHARPVPPHHRLSRPRAQGREPRQPAGAGAQQVRAHHQPEDSKGARPDRAADIAGDGRRGVRMNEYWRGGIVRTMSRRTFVASTTGFGASLGSLPPLLAQTNSSGPIRLLVPLAPGGATDPYARLIADHMARTLGRVIIVEHKPGGAGSIGTQYAAREPADGNLILLTTQAITEIGPSTFSDGKWSLDDFIPLIRGVQAPLVLVANPSVPARTLDELVAWIRKN